VHSIPSLRVIRVVEQLIELRGKPALALADIQQKRTDGERLVILPMALHAVGRHTEVNVALESLVQKFGDTFAYWIAMNYAYRAIALVCFNWLTRVYEQMKRAIEIVGESLRGRGRRRRRPRSSANTAILITGAACSLNCRQHSTARAEREHRRGVLGTVVLSLSVVGAESQLLATTRRAQAPRRLQRASHL
jgi:hypothetical protein